MIGLIIMVAFILAIIFFFNSLPLEGYHPMPYDEEVKLLMEQGCSKELAEEIASIPNWL